MKRLIPLFISLVSILSAGTVHSEPVCSLAPRAIEQINDSYHEVGERDTPLNFDTVNDAPGLNRDRFNHILSSWEEICPELRRQNVFRSRQDNLVCRIQGVGDEVLVAGAHFDKVTAGSGVADNWSGIIILDALLRDTLNQHNIRPPDMTIDFVAFAAEEKGLHGSKAYLNKRDRRVNAMMNIDSIGLTHLMVATDSDPKLTCWAQHIAMALGIPLSIELMRSIGGDWQSFGRKNIPSIGFHSVNRKTIKRIHNHRDKAGNVDLQKLEDAFRLVRLLLALSQQQEP